MIRKAKINAVGVIVCVMSEDNRTIVSIPRIIHENKSGLLQRMRS